MASLAPVLKQRFESDNGEPLAGGKLYTYEAGTATPKVTYADRAGLVPNTNPIILNARGECDLLFSTGSYKFVLKDADDVSIWVSDNVPTPAVEVNEVGALAIGNNLSDVPDKVLAVSNLGIAPLTKQVEFNILDGASAADLSGMSISGALFTSWVFEVEISRGTTVFVNQYMAMQYLNSTWRLVMGSGLTEEAHGITFSVSQTLVTGQLRAAANSGAGNAKIKIKGHKFTV